jgi:hypothetical protein
MKQKVDESIKNWKSNTVKKTKYLPDPDDDDFVDVVVEVEDAEVRAKRFEFNEKNKWDIHRFPDVWLTWYVFGPPLCCGHPQIRATEMQHLTKIKASKPMTEEEHVEELGQANKYVRRKSKSNRSKGVTPPTDDAITSESTRSVQAVKWIRPPPSAIETLNESINATKELMLLLVNMAQETGDEDGSIVEEIDECKKNLRQLLRDKIEECRLTNNKRKRESNDIDEQ